MSPTIVPEARWNVAPQDGELVRVLARELKLQEPAARILAARGYHDCEAARRFLSPSLDDLHDPFRLKDMDTAVDRLQRAIRNREKILLYGDYDVDGTTSVVILKKALEIAGASVDFFVPHRLPLRNPAHPATGSWCLRF